MSWLRTLDPDKLIKWVLGYCVALVTLLILTQTYIYVQGRSLNDVGNHEQKGPEQP